MGFLGAVGNWFKHAGESIAHGAEQAGKDLANGAQQVGNDLSNGNIGGAFADGASAIGNAQNDLIGGAAGAFSSEKTGGSGGESDIIARYLGANVADDAKKKFAEDLKKVADAGSKNEKPIGSSSDPSSDVNFKG